MLKEKNPEVSHLVFRGEHKVDRKLDWNRVARIEKNKIYLNIKQKEIPFVIPEDCDVLVSEILLDKQIIDTDGLKVIRVNDVILTKINDKLCITAVDVGTRGLLRRLGIENILSPIIEKVGNRLIPWEYVAPLNMYSDGNSCQNIQLTVSRSKLSEVHPADIADLMEDLSHKERAMVFNALDNKTAAETLVEAVPEVQQSVFKNVKKNKLAEIFDYLAPDEAVNLIGVLHKKVANELLGLITPEKAKKIQELVNYDKDTVGAMMNPTFVSVPNYYTADQTIKYLRKILVNAQHIFYVYVVDKEETLVGVLSLRSLILAQPNDQVETFMRTKIISIETNAPKKDAAKTILKYNLLALPVVNEKGKLLGVVTIDDVLEKVAPSEWKKKEKMKHTHRRKTKKKTEIKENTNPVETIVKQTENGVAPAAEK